MLVEVKGVQFVNKGAELMLHAVLEQLNKQLPVAEIVLLPGVSSPYKARARLGAWQKLSLQKGRFVFNGLSYYLPQRLRRYLQQRFGLVTEADVAVILDASGFSYGDQWPASSVNQLAGELRRFAREGKHYILLPQAFGPFSRPRDRRLLAKTLPLASLICARDEQSYRHLAELMPNTDNLVLFQDFTNLVSLDPAVSMPANTALLVPNANMLSKKSAEPAWFNSYLPFLVDAARQLQQLGYQPVFLNHEGVADQRLIDEVRVMAGQTYPVICEPDPVRVKSIIAGSAFVVSSRFHGCVSALSQGVPCIGTSWSHKYQALFADYLQSDALLPPTVTAAQFHQIAVALPELCRAPGVQERRDSLLQQSKRMWEQVFVTISR